MQTPRLGELLVARGLVSERELADALAMQQLNGGLLGQLLIRIGALSETKTGIEIVGVVGDISYRGLREQSEEAWFPIFEGDDSMATNIRRE